MDRHQQRAARTVIVMHDRAPVQPAGHAGRSAQIIQICAPRSATPGSKNLRQNGGSSGSAEAPSHLPSRKPGRFWAALMTAACPCPGCSCECLAACGADRRLILALRSERNVSGRTAQAGMLRACRWIGHLR